jgi:hypothetical protein
VAAICVRLSYLPSPNLLHGDWTFNDVPYAICLLAELALVTMTALAPNLPVFFQRTSTGALHFTPGDTMSGPAVPYVLSDLPTKKVKDGSDVYAGKKGFGNIKVRPAQDQHPGNGIRKRSSFDSDAILVRHSVEVETNTIKDGVSSWVNT